MNMLKTTAAVALLLGTSIATADILDLLWSSATWTSARRRCTGSQDESSAEIAVADASSSAPHAVACRSDAWANPT